MKRQTFLTLMLIALGVSFFVTPLGYFGKIWLMRLFDRPPEIISTSDRPRLSDYDWKLKDAAWNFFNFNTSKANVVFIKYWASWHTPSAAEMSDIQSLYDAYGDRIDFYVITNEERAPVEEFMEENDYTFPVTYRIVGEPAPLKIYDPAGAYVIGRDGSIAVQIEGNADWDNETVRSLLDGLLASDE